MKILDEEALSWSRKIDEARADELNSLLKLFEGDIDHASYDWIVIELKNRLKSYTINK